MTDPYSRGEGDPSDPLAPDWRGDRPDGVAYEWLQQGLELLDRGQPAAAADILALAADEEPTSRSVREALARAQFDAGYYEAALESFQWIVEVDPADDYAQFGLGLAATQVGNLALAVEHLALAAAMRPDVSHYGVALRAARSRLARGA